MGPQKGKGKGMGASPMAPNPMQNSMLMNRFQMGGMGGGGMQQPRPMQSPGANKAAMLANGGMKPMGF